jgi:hypothetical protein
MPVTVNEAEVALAAIDTLAGTVKPGCVVALDVSVTVVAVVTLDDKVTVHVICSPGSIWFARAPVTEPVSGAQVMAMVGLTAIDSLGVLIFAVIALAKALAAENAEIVTVAVPEGAVAGMEAATFATTAPVGIVLVLVPATTQFTCVVPTGGAGDVGTAQVAVLPAAVAPAPVVTVKTDTEVLGADRVN